MLKLFYIKLKEITQDKCNYSYIEQLTKSHITYRKKTSKTIVIEVSRDRDRIRTYDRLLRRQMLYPAELRDRTKKRIKI